MDRLLAAAPLQVPVMLVHSLWDQEDIYGAPAVYKALEPKDAANDKVYLVMGPWYHGQQIGDGSALGAIRFDSDTGLYFRRKILRPFLDQFLKDDAPPSGVAPVTAYDGTTNQQLLRGDTNLPPSGACRITFTVRVDYGVNPVPLGPQLNSVYASTASAANNGATVPDDPAQAPTYPANTITNDVSTDGPSLPLTPNGDTASPTPVTFAALGPALIPSLQQWLLWLLTLLLLSLGAWHLRREA